VRLTTAIMTTTSSTFLRSIALFAALACLLTPAAVRAEPATPEGEDVLGEIVVEATRDESKRIRLPPLLVRPAVGGRAEVIALHAVVARDLELSGMFELDAALGEPTPEDTRPRVIVEVRDDGPKPWLAARIEQHRDGEWTHREVTVPASETRDRTAAHRLADRVLGELTGRDGAFAGRLAVVRRAEGPSDARAVRPSGAGQRATDPRLYHADPDGRGLKVITPPSQRVVSTTFGPGGRLYYTASVANGAIKLYRVGEPDPLPVEPRGSIYGLSFGAKGRVALAIARGPRIEVWRGPELGRLERVREASMDMQPVLAPDGRVAYTAEVKGTTRIFIGTKAVTPGRASSPTWCDHPDGARLLWIERSSKSSWIWSRRPGQAAEQLVGVRGKISAATCSPDGRLLLFSYDDGRAFEGPGVYIGNIDVLRPRRILPHPARGLAWGPADAEATAR
jgi:Tol biopolymer transport system component